MKKLNKKLICSFVAVVLIGVIGFAALNYLVDPFGYFRLSAGFSTSFSTIKLTGDHNNRLRSVCNLKNTIQSDTYQGLIVGGSKSMPITAELMESYTGLKYLSCSASYGEFEFYEQIIRYALQHQQLRHVVLHLSGVEVWENPPSEGVETYRSPKVITSKNDYTLSDVIYYLFADVGNSINSIRNGSAPSLQERFTVQKGEEHPYSAINPRNKKLAEQMGISDYTTQDMHSVEVRISMGREFNDYYKEIQKEGAKEQWAENRVVNAYGVPYVSQLKHLFLVEKKLINKKSNIEHLRNIINMCNAYGVELTLIQGAAFLTERMNYECPEYWDYLHQIAALTDFYDFSYFCDINMNPYNFFDPSHNLDFVTCVMLDNIYGNGTIPFGHKITSENSSEYITQRINDFYRLESELKSTGTIQLPGLGSESDLSSLPGEFWLEMLSRGKKDTE